MWHGQLLLDRPMQGTRVAWLVAWLVLVFVGSGRPNGLAVEENSQRIVEVRLAHQWADSAFARPQSAPGAAEPPERLVIIHRSHKVLVNRTVWDTAITLGDKSYEHGLYMDAPATVQVRLAQPAVEFTALVGIDNNRDTQAAPTRSSARFTVTVREKPVAVTPVKRLQDAPTAVQVPLDGVQEFLLSVDDGDDGRSHDQCVWADPLVKLADGSVRRLDALPVGPRWQNRSTAPFSFLYGGERSDGLLPNWDYSVREERSPAAGVSRRMIRYRDPKTGLLVEAQVTRYADAAAIDWVFYLTNTGSAGTPLVEDFLPLDAPLATAPEGQAVLRWSNGDRCAADSFLPHDETLQADVPREFAAHSSNVDCFPFFNLKTPGGGWIVAVGWTGRWKADFCHDRQNAVRIRAGMQATRFQLRPGERVRTPRILLLRYGGEAMIRGHNQFRRLMLDRYVRRLDGRPAEPPVAYSSVAGLYVRAKETGQPLGRLNEDYELRMIAKAADLGCDTYWMDAYWYPQPWHENMGNWFPRPDDFPRGLRPLGDAAHGRGMKFVVWFAPLWVCPRTAFAKEHPQFIHGGERGGIWKVGEDRARTWITDWVSQRIDDWGIDVYRQDIDNALPPDEGPDRVGIAEMRHIEGFYQFWSDLLARHPGLLIDNCCGGGRRIDLETSSRAFTLWRSDFNDIGEGLKGKSHWPLMGRADQVMVSGLSLYLPFHTGPVWDMRPYCFRSAMSSGVVLYNDLESRDFSSDLARQGIAELKRLRPYFQGDIYPLLNLTTSQADWYAYQLDRPDLGAGCVLAFRRPESPDESRTLCLHAIDPAAQYDVRVTGETYAPAATQTLRGRDLVQLAIRITPQPGSALVEYKRR